MLSASNSDIFNLIGTTEIDSFNKTLNEMLTVWNDPIINNNSNISINQNSNTGPSSNDTSAINSILQGNGSYFNLPMPQISLRTSTKGLQQQIRTLMANKTTGMNTNNILSASQQLESLFMENSILNKTLEKDQVESSDLNQMVGDNDILKTINEITIEQKSFQPVEITPYKQQIQNSTGATLPLNSTTGSSNGFNQFILDQTKLDEIRFSQPFTIDPMLLQPYENDLIPTGLSASGLKRVSTTSAPIRNTGVQRFIAERDQVVDVMTTSAAPYGLNKDQLMNFTSSEMKEYVKVANSTGNLTPVEKKELKRQKRLIKNRESAHLSRQRKRERLTGLESRVEELSHNSVTINKTLTQLESENMVLKAEIGQLIEVIKDSPSLCSLFFSNIKNNQVAQELLSGVY